MITEDLNGHTAAQVSLTDTLYQQVAVRISELIEHGTLRPGERVPSVRKCSEQQSVSIATVMQAYRLLENRGVIEANLECVRRHDLETNNAVYRMVHFFTSAAQLTPVSCLPSPKLRCGNRFKDNPDFEMCGQRRREKAVRIGDECALELGRNWYRDAVFGYHPQASGLHRGHDRIGILHARS